MIDHTTALYCIVDDLLKAVGHEDDCRCELTDSESSPRRLSRPSTLAVTSSAAARSSKRQG